MRLDLSEEPDEENIEQTSKTPHACCHTRAFGVSKDLQEVSHPHGTHETNSGDGDWYHWRRGRWRSSHIKQPYSKVFLRNVSETLLRWTTQEQRRRSCIPPLRTYQQQLSARWFRRRLLIVDVSCKPCSQDVWKVYEGLNPISPMFTIAAAFGNVHGVYKA